jgi:hypothetical protein
MKFHNIVLVLCAGLSFVTGASPSAAEEQNATEDQSANQMEFVIRISQQFFDDLVKDTVEDRTPINQFALGAHSVGTADTSARFHIILEPMKDRAEFLIRVTGQTQTSTVAQKRSVQIQVGSQTDFDGRAIVEYDGLKFTVPDGEVTANSNMWFEQVSSTRRRRVGRLFRRIVLRSANDSKPEALAMLNEQAEAGVSARFDEALDAFDKKLTKSFPLNEPCNCCFRRLSRGSTTCLQLQISCKPALGRRMRLCLNCLGAAKSRCTEPSSFGCDCPQTTHAWTGSRQYGMGRSDCSAVSASGMARRLLKRSTRWKQSESAIGGSSICILPRLGPTRAPRSSGHRIPDNPSNEM